MAFLLNPELLPLVVQLVGKRERMTSVFCIFDFAYILANAPKNVSKHSTSPQGLLGKRCRVIVTKFDKYFPTSLRVAFSIRLCTYNAYLETLFSSIESLTETFSDFYFEWIEVKSKQEITHVAVYLGVKLFIIWIF